MKKTLLYPLPSSGLAAVLLLLSALAEPSAAATVAPPTAASGHIINAVPASDAVIGEGYSAADAPYTVQVVRDGTIVGTASGVTPDSAGAIQVNHPPGPCWGAPQNVTPDIQPGELVTITSASGVVEGTMVRNVTATPAQAGTGTTIVVHGIAEDAAGSPLPVAELEARVIVKGQTFSNGRKSLRATSAGDQDGSITYDAPGSIHWTAQYPRTTAADQALALGDTSQTVVLWTSASGTEVTEFEANGVVPGPQPPCTAPLEAGASGPSTPKLAAASDSGTVGDGITNIPGPTFIGSAGSTANAGDIVRLSVNGAQVASGTFAADRTYALAAPSPFADGRYTIGVSQVVGGVETFSPDTLTLVVDTLAPTVSITNQPPNPTNSGDLTFGFQANEANASFECSLVLANQADTFSACASPKSYANPPDGTYRFSVRPLDPAGNVGATASVAVSKDTVAPSISGLSATPPAFAPAVQSTTIVYTLSEAVAATRVVITNGSGAVVRTLTPSSIGSNTYQAAWDGRADGGTPVPTGSYAILATATDAAGNTGTATTSVVVLSAGV